MAEVQIFDKNEAEEVVKVGKAIQQTDDRLEAFIVNTEKLIKLINEQGSSLGALLSHYEKVKKGTSELDTVGKQLVKSEEKLIQIQDTRTKKIIENRLEVQKQTKDIKDKIKASQSDKLVTEAQNGAYDKIAKSLSSNIAKWKQMTQAERENSKAGKSLLTTIQSQDKQLKKLDAQIGRSQRHVGKYGNALGGVARNLLGAFGVVGGVAMFARVMKDAFGTIRSFTKENAVLAGVLGTTREEVEELTEQSIALGATYPVTASEVTKLQVSYARLGFTMSEINNLTEATILGSIALNAELDETATLVGAVVKAYSDLGTADAGMIIDQLTLSTQRSSLSFASLETALPKVAGAADALNESLSGTLSKLAIAQDATLDASTAGTSLRNIYLEITKKGLTYDEALDKIENSSNRLNTAFELFGKRGAIVGLALANNREKAEELRKEFDETGGVAESVAKEQMDTLDGSIKSLQSSWEKLILGFRGSDGVWRKIIDSATQFIDTFSEDRISGFNKFIELSTLGIWGLATEQQQALTEIEQRISKSNAKQIEYTLNLHREELENGGKFEKAKLAILEKGLENKRKSEQKEAEDKKKRDEKAELESELTKLAIEKEASTKSLEQRKKASSEALKSLSKLIDQRESIEETELDEQTSRIEREIQAEEDAYNEKIELAKEYSDSIAEIETQQAEQRSERQKAQDELDRQREEEEYQRRVALYQDLANVINNSFYEFTQGNKDAFKEGAKSIIQIALELLKVQTQLAIAGATIQALAQPDSVATFGVAGFARAVVLTALIEGAFGAVSGLVQGFADGTDNAPNNFVAGEKGRELMKLRTGELMMVDSATHFKGDKYKGATIWSNPETEQIISQAGKGNNYTFDTREIKEGLSRVENAIRKKPVNVVDKSGRIVGKQSGNYRETYLNRLQHGS